MATAAAPLLPIATNLTEAHRPMTLGDIRGQAPVVAQLQRFVAHPYSTAFVFAGATGTGKTSAAVALAHDLGIDRERPQFSGLYQIPSGEQTGEAVRKLYVGLCSRPMMGSGWNVAIVNEADCMTASAAQIWLDVLERLPPQAVVIFTTNHASKLQPRLRDRCTSHYFEGSAMLLQTALDAYVAELWSHYGGAGEAPTMSELDIVDEEGGVSFRRALRAIEPHLQDGTRPGAKSTPLPAAVSSAVDLRCRPTRRPSRPSSPSRPCPLPSPSPLSASLSGSVIYTVGHQRLTVSALIARADHFKALKIVDARANPQSPKPGWSRASLEAALGDRYEWRGDTLGGREAVADKALAKLAREAAKGPILLLGGKEAPGDCPRQHKIAVPLLKHGVDCVHVYRDELIDASELYRSTVEGDDYACRPLGLKVKQ